MPRSYAYMTQLCNGKTELTRAGRCSTWLLRTSQLLPSSPVTMGRRNRGSTTGLVRCAGSARGHAARRDASVAACVAALSLLPGIADTPVSSPLSSPRDSIAPGFSGSRNEPKFERSPESAAAGPSWSPACSNSGMLRPEATQGKQ